MWFMLAAGARPKETKINLMDCNSLCSEVEIAFSLMPGPQPWPLGNSECALCISGIFQVMVT